MGLVALQHFQILFCYGMEIFDKARVAAIQCTYCSTLHKPCSVLISLCYYITMLLYYYVTILLCYYITVTAAARKRGRGEDDSG